MDHQEPSKIGGAPPAYQPQPQPQPGVHYPQDPSYGFAAAPAHHDSVKNPGFVGLEVNQLPYPPYDPYSQPYIIQQVPNMTLHYAVPQDNQYYHSPPPPYMQQQQLLNQPPMPQVVEKCPQSNNFWGFSWRKIMVGVFFTLLAVKLVLVGILRS